MTVLLTVLFFQVEILLNQINGLGVRRGSDPGTIDKAVTLQNVRLFLRQQQLHLGFTLAPFVGCTGCREFRILQAVLSRSKGIDPASAGSFFVCRGCLRRSSVERLSISPKYRFCQKARVRLIMVV